MYLTLAAGFASVIGNVAEELAPGSGITVFSCLFGIGLFAIIMLGGELATGNMMFSLSQLSVGDSLGKGVLLVVVTTVFNLIGAIIVALILSQSAKLGGMENTHLLSMIAEGELDKPAFGAFVEAIGANFVVNMAIVGSLKAQDLASKVFATVPIVSMFVVLGLEHIIANFSIFALASLADPLPANFDVVHLSVNWVVVWLGNFVGGGFGIGVVYAWLNKTKNQLH